MNDAASFALTQHYHRMADRTELSALIRKAERTVRALPAGVFGEAYLAATVHLLALHAKRDAV